MGILIQASAIATNGQEVVFWEWKHAGLGDWLWERLSDDAKTEAGDEEHHGYGASISVDDFTLIESEFCPPDCDANDGERFDCKVAELVSLGRRAIKAGFRIDYWCG